jgi:hypothetical protein
MSFYKPVLSEVEGLRTSLAGLIPAYATDDRLLSNVHEITLAFYPLSPALSRRERE